MEILKTEFSPACTMQGHRLVAYLPGSLYELGHWSGCQARESAIEDCTIAPAGITKTLSAAGPSSLHPVLESGPTGPAEYHPFHVTGVR